MAKSGVFLSITLSVSLYKAVSNLRTPWMRLCMGERGCVEELGSMQLLRLARKSTRLGTVSSTFGPSDAERDRRDQDTNPTRLVHTHSKANLQMGKVKTKTL